MLTKIYLYQTCLSGARYIRSYIWHSALIMLSRQILCLSKALGITMGLEPFQQAFLVPPLVVGVAPDSVRDDHQGSVKPALVFILEERCNILFDCMVCEFG